MQELDGCVAVVTGAGSGIGRSLAGRLAVEGVHVVLADVPSSRNAARTSSPGSSPAARCSTDHEVLVRSGAE